MFFNFIAFPCISLSFIVFYTSKRQARTLLRTPKVPFRSKFWNADPSKTQVLEGVAFQNFERNRFRDHQKSKSVRSFETPTLQEYRFWKGSHSKTSNEIASATPSEAISFEVFKCEPFQNLCFGRVGVSKHRTELQIRAAEVGLSPSPTRALVHPRRDGLVHRRAPQIGQNATGPQQKGTLA